MQEVFLVVMVTMAVVVKETVRAEVVALLTKEEDVVAMRNVVGVATEKVVLVAVMIMIVDVVQTPEYEMVLRAH